MISLNNEQLKAIMAAARQVPHERRGIFLERIGTMLKLKGRFNDADVAETAKLAACGLVHRTDAA